MGINDSGARLFDISTNDVLSPEYREHVVGGKVEPLMNADAVIKMIRSSDTSHARELWRKYRKALAKLRRVGEGRSPEKLRSTALMRAMQQSGVEISGV
ncbi:MULTISPECIES: hypothetical protein [unclassified Mesorhizobium]|uniref:hypothetical protein n=1 Tax=unclassified Mesorhizobium TaxID=325217 RepID=UPI0003CF7732|nr:MULTISPECIES: hypothetical protein [unclassified Mesorhizobium]ESX29461.1 hypothetical protein X765_14210 [Mesorhizobium sp. LSHC440B00]ESX37768.1 hypothetical protein X763_12725 [Mesorhizobium sp. LSHC432A00]ESX43271.1 hypothetical protein X764_07995 [Mesorhizobium sp. LSHC440A00]ESY48077.1 hypothetical protein X746_11370 [Mesorhizobium sp. LNJC380A00]WJI57392.1 hypothetical protein NLY33_01125 [Mesorhizobium sp. C432A]